MVTVLTHNFLKIKIAIADRKSVTNKRMIDSPPSPKSIDFKFHVKYVIKCKLFSLILLVAWSYPPIAII